MQAKVQKLVVDTSAFINVVSLWEYADEFYCIEDVIKEIKNRRTLQHIDSFPFQLHFREPSPASVKFINDFTKKTGDFASLSLTDVKLLALTYELEVENKGDASHLCLEPIQQRTALIVSTKSSINSSEHVEGFYNPPKQDNNSFSKSEELSTEDISGAFEKLKVISEEIEDENSYNNEVNGIKTREPVDEVKTETKIINIEPQTKETIDGIETEDLKDGSETEDHENFSSEEEYVYSMDDDSGNEDCNFEEEDDDEGWITPSNIRLSRQEPLPDDVQIACITGDYAMQNILKHIGLHVMGVDGKVIKSLRTYILRCFACFKTTSKMGKIFCPSCGNKTLKKVAVTLNPDGTQKIWISNRKPINVRGTLCPLPMPKGGHHAKNPILVADQRITPHKIPRKSRMRNNPMHEDYIVQAGVSPFTSRDVYSRSAQLGYQTGRSRHRGMLNHEQRGQNSSQSRGTSRRKKR